MVGERLRAAAAGEAPERRARVLSVLVPPDAAEEDNQEASREGSRRKFGKEPKRRTGPRALNLLQSAAFCRSVRSFRGIGKCVTDKFVTGRDLPTSSSETGLKLYKHLPSSKDRENEDQRDEAGFGGKLVFQLQRNIKHSLERRGPKLSTHSSKCSTGVFAALSDGPAVISVGARPRGSFLSRSGIMRRPDLPARYSGRRRCVSWGARKERRH